MLQVLEQRTKKNIRHKQQQQQKKKIETKRRHKQLKKHLGKHLSFPSSRLQSNSVPASFLASTFCGFAACPDYFGEAKNGAGGWNQCIMIFFCCTSFLTHFPTVILTCYLFPFLQHRSNGCSPWGMMGHPQLQSLRVIPALLWSTSSKSTSPAVSPTKSHSMCLPIPPNISLPCLFPPVAATLNTSEQRHHVLL